VALRDALWVNKTVQWGVIIVAMILGQAFSNSSASGVTLVENGTGKAIITVGADAPPVVSFAAEQLQGYLKKISGAELPIVEVEETSKKTLDSFARGRTVILVGESKYTREMGISTRTFKADGFKLICRDNVLVIVGKDDADLTAPPTWGAVGSTGTLYAVYRFLERLEVRFYYPGEVGEVVPKKKTITLSNFRIEDAPYFPMRRLQPPVSGSDADLWIRKIGGGATVYPAATCHSFGRWTNKYFDTHPEYFALRADGKRNKNYICFYGPGVRQQMIKDAKEFFRTHDAQKYPYFTVMENDGAPGPCQCPECRKRLTPDRGWYGTMSDYVAEAAIEVANAIKDQFPDRGIIIGAYNDYTLPPTNIKRLPSNVAVQIFKHRQQMWSEETRKRIYSVIEGWLALKPKEVGFWEYYNFDCWGKNWRGVPGVTTEFVAKDIKRLKRLSERSGVPFAGELVFCDGRLKEHYEDRLWWLGLDYYLTAKLLWNPDLDRERMLDEFYKKFFGPAAEPMRKLYSRAEEVWVEGDHGGRNFYASEELDNLGQALAEGFVAADPWKCLFTAPVLEELDGYLKEAEALATDSPYRERVALVRKGLPWTLAEASGQ